MSGVDLNYYDVPEQGISIPCDPDEFAKFFDEEIKLLTNYKSILSRQIIIGSRAVQQPLNYTTLAKYLSNIRDAISKEDRGTIEDYVEAARCLHLVIGQGTIGQQISYLKSKGFNNEAQWLYLLYSRNFTDSLINEYLTPFRAIIIGNPIFANFGAVDLARTAASEATEARNSALQILAQFNELYTDKKNLMDDLEQLFRKKIPVEEAATYWKNASTKKTREWIGWLVLFIVLTLGPTMAMLHYWDAVASAVVQITNNNASILGGIALFTVPALLYGWLLKNVSRMLIQTSVLAEDAAHRRLLTMTYLGLAKEPQLNIADNERAIILNALFRPMPPYTSDDGPPSGLIELIGRKSP